MANEKKDQLIMHTDQVIENIDLYHNPKDLAEEMLKRISKLPPEIIERNQFIVECQGKSFFHDVKNETIEIRNGAIRVTMIPLTS